MLDQAKNFPSSSTFFAGEDLCWSVAAHLVWEPLYLLPAYSFQSVMPSWSGASPFPGSQCVMNKLVLRVKHAVHCVGCIIGISEFSLYNLYDGHYCFCFTNDEKMLTV